MRRARTFGWTAAAAAVAGFVACSDGARIVGDAMVDAAGAMRDAGELVRDSGSDAAAQPMIVTAECNVVEGNSMFAEAAVAIDVDRVAHVVAVLCDLEGTYTAAGGLHCVTRDPYFDRARVRVFCGSGDPAAGGYRHRSVRFVIE